MNSGIHVTAFLCGKSITIIKRSSSKDGMMEFTYRLEDIPADNLMNSLNATDYYEMMNIISLLLNNNIHHHTTQDSCNLTDFGDKQTFLSYVIDFKTIKKQQMGE